MAAAGGSSGHSMERNRALAPTTNAQSAIAWSSCAATAAFSKMASAPAARAVACALGNSRGLTNAKCRKPMFAMARAAAPMLPGWVGSSSTTRI